MEVSESEWVSKGIDNVDKYLNRGGDCEGDNPQFLGGTDLQNTIGIAMGLPLYNPEDWTKSELERAFRGELVFFKGDSLKAINVIADAIVSACDGDSKNYITIIPIELYYNGKLYELPVFRAHRYKDSKKYYVDNTGRVYDSVSDWYNNSKLPPCKMLYPVDLRLKLRPGYKYSHVYVASTPSARGDAKVARGIDTVSAVAGISSGVGLLFVSGGLAAPLVVVGAASAIWGSARATHQLADRATHGESINPFTNTESRMLWIGIAANVASFGAMGATMRLTSLAARGREISTALRIITNVANGTSLTLSTLAILNNTVYLIEHFDDLSKLDVLMHLAAIAFWTKGVYTYKTAGALIREAEVQAFKNINKELSPERQQQLEEVRNRVQNDASLLRQFIAASQSNVSIQEYSQVLIDGMQYYDTLSNMTPEQVEAFANLRNVLRDDLRLVTGLQRVAQATNLNRQQTLELVVGMWQRYAESNFASTSDISLRGGALVLGSAPPIRINQMPELSVSMIRFFGEHLSKIDVSATSQWSVPELLALQNRGLFTDCPVTGISRKGHSTLMLADKLEISVKKLQSMSPETCRKMFTLVAALTSNQSETSARLPADIVRLCVRELRLRFEVHRRESVEWALSCASQRANLCTILRGDLMPHERDRLFTFKSDVAMCKADEIYMGDMMKFVSEQNPRNVSELVAYAEFVMTYVEEAAANIQGDIAEGRRQVPRNIKKTRWAREQASREVFADTAAMKEKLAELLRIVDTNDMVGVQTLESGLSDGALVSAVRSHRIRFGGRISAAYHIYKHRTDPITSYVDRANNVMRQAAEPTVTIGQQGDTRLLSFKTADGSCIVLESNGRVLLCTFTENVRR
ncbi:unnamed protein product [Leptosia nina]|uniref:DUF4781 domain-containing protein n=1 Tax=Leptosia nina TaxID=320188 RepID=A0AAV1JNQ8_9NEOP